MQRLTPVSGQPMMQGVLPTPRIRQVKLSYSPLPPRVNNPHIDHEREVIIYKDRAGKQKLKHPGFLVKKDPRNLLVEVTVVLMDEIKQNGQSNWVYEQDLVKYMHLQLVHSENKEFTKMLKSGQVTPVPSEINKHRPNNNTVKVETRSLSNIVGLEGFYKDENFEPGTQELVLKFKFAVNTASPEHLTYFTNVYFDVEQMANDYSLNLSKEMLFSSCGNTTVEAVYRDGQRVSTAKMYMSAGTSNAYAGPVYKVASNKYIPANTLNDNLIRRDMLQVLASLPNVPANSTGAQYKKHLENITKKDSDKHTKYEQVKKMLSSWKKRSPNTMSGRIYDLVHGKMKLYNNIINKASTLNVKVISNSTIKDERTIEQLSIIPNLIPQPSDEDAATVDIRNKDYNTTSATIGHKQPAARYFSPCMLTRDSMSSCRLSFVLDWYLLAVESSAHKNMIQRSSRDIQQLLFSKISLQGARLIRERIDDEKVLQQFDNHMTRDRESIVEVIAHATPQSNGMLAGHRFKKSISSTEDKRVGTFSEISLAGITSNNRRAFAARDVSVANRKTGSFRYRVELQYIDKISEFLYEKIKELRKASRRIRDYYNMSNLACNYDEANDRFSEFYISGLYKKYSFPNPDVVAAMTQQELTVMLQNGSITTAPWITPIAKYVEILQIVAALSSADATELAKKMYLELEPSFATPDSILTTVNRFESLEQQIIDMILIDEPATASYLSDNSKIVRKLTKSQTVSYLFPEVYNNKTLSNVGTKYLYYDQETEPGLAKITRNDFIKRMAEEEVRFYTNQPAGSKDAIQDMLTYRYSYIAPAHIKVGSRNLMLLNRGPALYETEQYKDMMFSISLLQAHPAARSMTMPVLNFSPGTFDPTTTADLQAAKINAAATSLLSLYGITISAQTPYLSTRLTDSDPLVEVTSILGENTLLAIRNAISSSAEESADLDDIGTIKPDMQISVADVSSIASSLVGTLASTGLQNFLGTKSAYSQVATIDMESRQKMQFAKTLEFFDIANPKNAISAQTTYQTGPESGTKIRKIPNQVKSLFLAKTNQVAPAKQWHTMEVDPIASPDTRPLFELLYFNLQKIEVLKGFSTNALNNRLMKAPIYELLTADHLNGKGQLLCKLTRYRNDTLHIGDSQLLALPVYNQYFILDLSSNNTVASNNIAESGLYTAGGEYQTPDGTNYIGDYHIHKDKTAMTGKEMSAGEVVLTPYSKTTTDQGFAAAQLNAKMAPSMSEIQSQVVTTMITEHYTQKDVQTDYCATEDVILAVGAQDYIKLSGGSF